MSRVVIVGGGICGLGTALLLSRDGHDVTILEKDSEAPPQSLDECWDGWSRRGVAQFRQPHNFMPGLRRLLEADLPEIQAALIAAGSCRFDMLNPIPKWLSGSAAQPIDEQLWTYTCRRPTGEWVFLSRAENDPGIRIRRGVTVKGLITGPSSNRGEPHVSGVCTANGESVPADLVIDASGRGSRASQWLKDLGVAVPDEEAADSNFTYLTRFFVGREPERRAPILAELGSISILTLPGDCGSWSVTVLTSSRDRELKRLRNADVWTKVVRAYPLHAHWLDGEPISDVLVMSGVVDRYRRFANDRGPLVTGFVAVADAWACTNPSAGRGMTVGMLHARRLRDCMRRFANNPWELARNFDEVTERELRPWYDAQIASDRVRFAAMEASRIGEADQLPSDPLARDLYLLRTGMLADGELFRLGMEYIATLATAQEIMERPGVRLRILEAVDELSQRAPGSIPGPNRAELLEILV